MAWSIKCSDPKCGSKTKAWEIVDLIQSHRDKDGWFVCECGKHGYVEKHFNTQEGKTWDPYLRGVIPLGVKGNVYQPFVFLVSDKPKGRANDIWFSYYKDLRKKKGRLKLGYGPGGPPVLNRQDVLDLVCELVRIGTLSKSQIKTCLL
jgi:hypothetical protein